VVLVGLAHAQVVFVDDVAVVAVGDAGQANIGGFDFGVGEVAPEVKQLLEVTKASLYIGIEQAVAGKNGVSEAITAHEVIPEKAAKPVSFDDLPEEHTRLLTLVKIIGITLLIVGLAIAIWRVLLGVLIAIMGGALYSVALYFGRRLLRLAAEEHASQTVTVTPIPARTHVQH